MDGCVNGLDGLDLDVGFESSPGSAIEGVGSERVLIVRFASAGPFSLHFFIVTFLFDTHTEFPLCLSQCFKPRSAGANTSNVLLLLQPTSPINIDHRSTSTACRSETSWESSMSPKT